MIRLRKGLDARTFSGKFRYIVIHNVRLGLPTVYDVIVPTESDPVVIGRELTLPSVRWIIGRWERAAKDLTWFGDRRSVLKHLKLVKEWRG